jgi:hypothetical protein
MASQFTHGYALLIGVGTSTVPEFSLPVTVNDVKALHSILINADFCAYLNNKEHIRILHDATATRSAMLDGLAWLGAQVAADRESTAIVYYSGHGWLEQSAGEYYLIPHDITPVDFRASALSARDFINELRSVTARRLLVFIDSCHAEGMATAKDTHLKLPSGFVQMAIPKGVTNNLKQGEGRAVFTSSRGDQQSWVRSDGTLSIYTYHLLEALQGAGNQPGDTLVRVSNLMNHLGKAVPTSARELCHAEQVPFFDTATEDFPVAMLQGGKGLPTTGWTTVQPEAIDTIQNICQSILGESRAIALGQRATTEEREEITIGRSIASHRFEANQVQGDQIVVGDISGGSSIAVGRGAKVTVIQDQSDDKVTRLFATVYQQIETRSEDPDLDREELIGIIQRIEAEVVKTNRANPNKIKRWLQTLASISPDIFGAVVVCLKSPIVSTDATVRTVVEQVCRQTES